jgi:hypothetical protein
MRQYKRDGISRQTRIKEIGKGVQVYSRTMIIFSRLDAVWRGQWELALTAHVNALCFSICARQMDTECCCIA